MLARVSLFFRSFFPSCPRIFRGSVGITNPCSLEGCPCLAPKEQGKEGQGVGTVPVVGSNGSSGESFSWYFSRVRTERHGPGSGFGSREMVPAVPVPLSAPGKTQQCAN